MYVYLLPLPITDLDVHLDAMSESCALIESVEGEFLDERDTASRSHSTSHLCRMYQALSCTVSMHPRVCSAVAGSSACRKAWR